MELQTFIDTEVEYFKKFKELNLHVKTYKNMGLLLVKYHYDKNYDLETYPWIRYCRGAVINTKTKKVICVPPMKAVQETDISKILDEYDDGNQYQLLIDGTMLNVFYHEGEWLISTRSSIGAKNSWEGKQSFISMMNEVINMDTLTDKLSQEYCYSFTLVHKNNRNVSPIFENNIYLVE